MKRWWQAPSGSGETSYLIAEAKLHDPSAWKKHALEATSVRVSNATAEILHRIQETLTITPDPEDPEHIQSADLQLRVTAEQAERILRLLEQVKKDKHGNVLPFTNAYRFVRCEPCNDGTGDHMAVARIAAGSWSERVTKSGTQRTHKLDMIPVTTGFQQLLASYAVPDLLAVVPKPMRGGVAQEVAQQVTSYLGQLASAKVKGEVEFPTTEDRDPLRRRQAYEQAIRSLVSDLEPLALAKLRDVFPGEYAADDPKGDRLIVHDERWFAVTTTPEPHPIPLLFPTGDAVRIIRGSFRFDAGVSKANRHRGRLEVNPFVLEDRPKGVQAKGSTGLQSWYIAVPLKDGEQPIATMPGGRGLDQSFQLMPICGGGRYKPKPNEILFPISGNRDRLERILNRRDLEIAWTRLVMKRDEWYVQITVRYKNVASVETGKILGVSFDTDAIATWVLLDREGTTIDQGQLASNPQIKTFIQQKLQVEWDQEKQRWVGDRASSFAKRLEAIAHSVANQLTELATEHGAILALEDISYVQKSGPSHNRNVLFTAWNYGQLRRFVSYKAPIAGLQPALFTNDYIVGFTCPNCNAIRTAKQKPGKETTYRENGTLHCRKCGVATHLTPYDRARRVALHAIYVLDERDKREAAKRAQQSA